MVKKLLLLLIRKKHPNYKMNTLRTKIFLLIILILAAFLRFYQLEQNPPSLNWDEVSHGYNAFSILKSGQDEWGKFLPTIFRAYGDYKLPVYIYLTSGSIALFGLNAFAVRFPSALAGILAVWFTFLLTKKLFKKDLVAMLSALFLALSPWHLFVSRPAFEANLASFLVLAGIWAFLTGLERKWFLALSVFLLGLSVHTYNSARIFTPLFLILLVIFYRKEIKVFLKKREKEAILTVIFLALFFIPLVVSFISPTGWARYKWVSVLDQGAINRINMARGESTLPGILPRLVHNKVNYFSLTFVKNYLSNLSPQFLFFKGGSNYQYNIPGEGIIYPVQLPLILVGLYYLFKNWRLRETKVIIFWLLLAIIPSAATRENPHVLRTILVLPLPYIIGALGFMEIWTWLKRTKAIRWLLVLIFVFFLIFSFWDFWKKYFNLYRQKYSWSWQYGYSQVAQYVKDHYNEYDRFLITKKYGEPHEFLLFYLQWDPEKYRQDPNLVRYFQTDWYWVDGFDKFIFINDWEIKDKAQCQDGKKCLLVTSPDNYPQGWESLKTINFLDGEKAFEILKHD
ncbi:glycosyltransferase family 39 protein [Candidatus Shapirobacteria bacterium]|nr:glycosyltransferase family 39 protein [Candidatus Shapirobacteria bacterium]